MSPGFTAVVVDSSVVLALVLPDEPIHGRASAFVRDAAERSVRLVAAPNFGFEVRHGLVRACHRGRLQWRAVAVALRAIDALAIEATVVASHDDELLAFCRRHRLSWGDAHHVHLAAVLGAPLVTADGRLARSLRGSATWVEDLANRPDD